MDHDRSPGTDRGPGLYRTLLVRYGVPGLPSDFGLRCGFFSTRFA